MRSTGRPVQSAAWQEILIVPGTGQSALDIFLLLRGKYIFDEDYFILYYFGSFNLDSGSNYIFLKGQFTQK